MFSDAETIIAFIFRRIGKTEIEYSELYLTLSMDLNWFTPDNAKTFINKAIEKKLLEKKDGIIMPCFDIKKINVQLGFYPSKTLFKEKTSINKPKEKNTDNTLINWCFKNLK